MKNNNKIVKFVFMAIIILIGIYLYSSITTKQELSQNNSSSENTSGKTVIIEHPDIFLWFQDESSLCDISNINTSPEREKFCTNKDIFKTMSRFVDIQTTQNNLFTVFTIETDALAPDTVVGIQNRETDKVTMLTNYYLGNDFINLSPDESFFVYRTACFESKCGYGIYDLRSDFLTSQSVITTFNIPEFLDAREENSIFVEWISNDTFNYKIGDKSLSMTLI